MKGFVITLDAILALGFLLIAIILISSQTFISEAPQGTYLKQISLDTLTILEKTDRLELALSNSSNVREILISAPESICMELEIIDGDFNVIAVILKPNCGSYEIQVQSSTRTFFYDGETYLARLKSWYKND